MTTGNVSKIDRIVVDYRMMGGQPIVRDTGISVEQVLIELARELEPRGVLRVFPQLTIHDIQAVLKFASHAVSQARDIPAQRSIEELGWSSAEAADTRWRLQAFAEDWDDPSMDVYDAPLSR